MRRIARRMGRSENAEDYLQAAFVKLEQYRANNEVQNTAAFLVHVAANVALDDVRRENMRGTARLGLDLDAVAALEPLQDEVLIARERLSRVAVGLAQLSPRTREIFLMHRIEGLKYREIAERLALSVSAVEKHIAKAALFLAGWTDGW